MVDGRGDPNNSKSFEQAVEALYSLSYTLKFSLKKSPRAIDYGVMPLEGLWWADDPRVFFGGRQICVEVDRDDPSARVHLPRKRRRRLR